MCATVVCLIDEAGQGGSSNTYRTYGTSADADVHMACCAVCKLAAGTCGSASGWSRQPMLPSLLLRRSSPAHAFLLLPRPFPCLPTSTFSPNARIQPHLKPLDVRGRDVGLPGRGRVARLPGSRRPRRVAGKGGEEGNECKGGRLAKREAGLACGMEEARHSKGPSGCMAALACHAQCANRRSLPKRQPASMPDDSPPWPPPPAPPRPPHPHSAPTTHPAPGTECR